MQIKVTLPPDVERLINRLSAERGTPKAVIIREFLERGLRAAGYDLSTGIRWGGRRDKPDDAPPA